MFFILPSKIRARKRKIFIQSSNYHLPNSEENIKLYIMKSVFDGQMQMASASAKKLFYSTSFPTIRI